MDKTIRLVSHEQCTGCGACYNKCPVDAISMKPDSEGFLFPEIETGKCVNCGLCLKTCPVVDPQYHNQPEPSCFAVMANDDIRAKSSSGGVFTELAEWILSLNGIVCGAVYSEDCYHVKHILVSNREDLKGLRGSKYVQSDTGLVFRKIKDFLDAGTHVLFTGTPCQVAAILHFLQKPYDNLYTLDLVCHGVPSPAVYEMFIREQEKAFKSKAIRVSFRDKDFVNWNVSTTIEFEDGQVYRKKRNECGYMKTFLNLLSLRKCCGSCLFAKLPRQGDLTIADFWDIHRFNPEFDDHKGTSMVLVNNEKGQNMLDILKKNSILCARAPLDHAVKYNAQVKYSSILNPRRSRFFDLLETYKYSFDKAADYGLNRRFDVGFVGWWYGANYGSVMTNFALHQVLKSMHKSVLMLEWPILSGEVPKSKPNTRSRRFASHFYDVSMSNRLEDYKRFNYHCETFLVGSDQLWNWWSNRDVGSYYFFLDFVDNAHKKIAYSTSFGHELAYYPEDMRLKVSYLLHRFDAVSCREGSGVTTCRRDFGVNAVQTVDPVFLCDMESYEEAISLSEVEIEGPYLLAYILNPTSEKMESIRYAAGQMGLPYYVILDGQDDFEKLKEQADDPNVLEHVEIADWLKYFKHASYVVTDSFHGFCFSIIFRHNMSVFPNKLRGLARFETLSGMTGLGDRLVYTKEEMIDKQPWNEQINFSNVDARMQQMKEYSRQWLKDMLEMRKLPPNSQELALKEIFDMKELLAKLQNENQELGERIEELEKREGLPFVMKRNIKNTMKWLHAKLK